jgi:predicted Zn-dependent peptidase
MSEKIVFDNGPVLLYDDIPSSKAVSVGLWLNLGSRDENIDEHGFSHFTEHMLFKGTDKRGYYDIAQEIDSKGGDINGITGKESTNYYVNISSEYLRLALDILFDMFFHSSFDREEFEKERLVILDEIELSFDDHDEHVSDIFSKLLWGEHSLGLPVIGEGKSIKKARIEDLRNFYKKNYIPPRAIISVAGRIDGLKLHQEVELLLEKIYAESVMEFSSNKREPPVPKTGGITVNRNVEQIYFICGRDSYSYSDENRYAFALLNIILGSSFSSRLFQRIRENKGLCYFISSTSASYYDTGEFTINFSTSVKNFPKVLEALDEELKLIKRGDIKKVELENAKGRYRGNYILAQESNEWKMTKMALQQIMFGRLIPYDETLRKIERVTLDDLNRIALELFYGENFGFSCIGPKGIEKCLDNFRFTF